MKFVVPCTSISIFRGLIQVDLPAYLKEHLDKLAGLIAPEKGHSFDIAISVKRKRRSLTANACLWATLGEMAAELQTTAEELYLEELRKYGHFEYFMCIPGAVDTFSKTFRICKEREKRVVNGVEMVVLQAWPGSHTYDTKQFSVLLDGVIQDAKEMGITVITREERDLLLEEREAIENVIRTS